MTLCQPECWYSVWLLSYCGFDRMTQIQLLHWKLPAERVCCDGRCVPRYLCYFWCVWCFRLKVGVIHDKGEHLLGHRGLGLRVRVLGSGCSSLLPGRVSGWLLCSWSQSQGDAWAFRGHLWFGDVDHRPETAGYGTCSPSYLYSIYTSVFHILHLLT